MCFTKEIWTFIFWWLIPFEPLEQKQSYIPLLKVLVCGMNSWGSKWLGGIFTFQYTILKMTVLLHKLSNGNHFLPRYEIPWFSSLYRTGICAWMQNEVHELWLHNNRRKHNILHVHGKILPTNILLVPLPHSDPLSNLQIITKYFTLESTRYVGFIKVCLQTKL